MTEERVKELAELGEAVLIHMDRDQDCLIHYGRIGMKWYQHIYGDYQDHAKYSGKVGASKNNYKNRMNSRWGQGKDIERFGKVTKNLLNKHPTEKLSDLKKLDKGTSVETARAEVNKPDSGETSAGRHYNCPNCAAAFELIERGYDVKARPKKDGSNVGNIESFFEGGTLKTCDGAEDSFKKYGYNEAWESYNKTQNAKYLPKKLQNDWKADAKLKMREATRNAQEEVKNKTLTDLKEQGDGSRGIVVVGWKGDADPNERSTAFHAFNYKVQNGEVKFYDTQSRSSRSQNGGVRDDFFYDADPRDVYTMQTNNLPLSENITKAVYSNRKKDSK